MITKNIQNLLFRLDNLMEYEALETFPDDQLREWIKMLKMGVLRCPCHQLNYSVYNCLFYAELQCDTCDMCDDCEDYDDNGECKDGYPSPRLCRRYCDGCEGVYECEECPRSGIWRDIEDFPVNYFRMNYKLTRWFVGQILAKKLESLL